MAYTPRFSHLLKILFRIRDPDAADGLFLEGSVEFESGNLETARLIFYYGTRLDPRMAGNFYNLAATIEKIDGPGREALAAWRRYLEAAEDDPRQSGEEQERVRRHVEEIKTRLDKPNE